MPSEELTITIPLRSFLRSHLGERINPTTGARERMWSNRPIDHDIAEIILSKTKNEFLCHVQYADEFSPHLTEPVLWDIVSWRSECDRWVRERIASDKRRDERFILEANAKIVAKAWSTFSGMRYEDALPTAYKLLWRKNLVLIGAIGVTKLIANIEEI